MQLNECAAYLKENDRFLLVTHKRPDGDTIGSAAALCRALRQLGKTAWLYPNPEVTDNYSGYFAPLAAPDDYLYETVVSVDVASEGLFPLGFSGNVDLAVDHHPSNSNFAQRAVVWSHKASCGELVLELIKALGVPVDKTIAELLYVAVSTDTGCFCYGNTKPETLRTAAELIELGAENAPLNKKLFRTVSKARLTLEGLIYSGLTTHRNGKISIATVTLDMMEMAGATENDCDDLASLAGKVAGSCVSATIRELEPGVCKVSVRTGLEVKASAVCERFGGGGHDMAAGFTVHMNCADTKAALLQAINEVWQ